MGYTAKVVGRRAVVVGAAGLLVGLAGLAGCSSGGGSGGSGGGQHLSVADFEQLAARPGTLVLDVRTPSEYAAGHLSSAVNVDFEDSGFGQKIAGMDKSVTYAVYCRSGRRSAEAIQQMSGAGFTNVSDLDGGITAWTAAGHALVTTP